MAEIKKEEVVESTTKKEQPKVDNEVGKIKVKKPRMKKLSQGLEEEVVKVDLSKPATEEVKDEVKEEIKEEVLNPIEEIKEEIVEDKKEEAVSKETPIVEEITEEEKKEVEEAKEEIVKAVEDAEATGKPIPENVQKLMDFMEETGGDLEDYVKLNRDVSKLDDQDVLYEYYKQTRPHLNNEEINFLMNDQFEYDEEVDDEKQVKRKKLALKEQVASARAHLDGQKSKYYEDIKAGSKLTPEQQKAMDFFNRYNKESEKGRQVAEEQKSIFNKKTGEVFNDKFKGFEYNVGDKKFRFNVKDANQVKETQSDINNFVKKFLNKNNSMEDARGYHKSLFTAMNADSIAQHFYEQGRADATKDRIAKDKNISFDSRQSHSGGKTDGLKFKVLGDSSSDFKFKIKNQK
jgi:hypothetical protein|tara:strand:- start:896 stop:2107 length:1212 start_codon:yes stop_codon:yes gene_type:complete